MEAITYYSEIDGSDYFKFPMSNESSVMVPTIVSRDTYFIIFCRNTPLLIQ